MFSILATSDRLILIFLYRVAIMVAITAVVGRTALGNVTHCSQRKSILSFQIGQQVEATSTDSYIGASAFYSQFIYLASSKRRHKRAHSN